MIKIYNLLSEERIFLAPNSITSHKKVLETLARLLADNNTMLENIVLRKLVEREKLGSTCIGKGIAIPHCRIEEIDKPRIALLKTEAKITCDAPDNISVTLFIALIVPQQATEAHLQLLAQIVQILDQQEALDALHNANTPAQVYTLFRHYAEALPPQT
ncbi:MAG: PTS sugar transporter subunit IIA [Candidatus Oxydemutatoraceae bacterium WSBS_2016_MAG_OTU14]